MRGHSEEQPQSLSITGPGQSQGWENWKRSLHEHSLFGSTFAGNGEYSIRSVIPVVIPGSSILLELHTWTGFVLVEQP